METLEIRRVLSVAGVEASSVDSTIVFETDGPLVFDGPGTEYPEFEHSAALELDSGTVALTFTADSTVEKQGLFSKDHSGYQDGGHLTAFIVDGRVKVRLQNDSESVYLYSAENSITAGQEHHVAVTFGEDGFRLFVDGLIADAAVDFTQGIAPNDNPLVIGANAWSRDGDRANLQNFFRGTIADFTIYAGQHSLSEVAELAGLDLTPLAEPTMIDGVLVGTDDGEWLYAPDGESESSVDGSYGDDFVIGGLGNDRLDGGHGEDVVYGGLGDDVLVSRSDGREPVIAQLYDGEDDPYGEVDPLTRTLYSDQPIAADDLLIGGPGADTFRFEILINAKERILFKHVNEDGTIDWAGVTGENRLVHDHWVGRIGNDVIYDFNREEGDTIEIVGHTADVYDLTHHDTDGDGVLDASMLHVQSNQGNAGAHNKDKLGLILIYGDLVHESDYTVNAHANLGIVETIGELGEALSPRYGKTVTVDDDSRWAQANVDEGPLPEGAVFAVGQPLDFSGESEDYIEVAHSAALELDSGTVALTFTADSTVEKQGLFSKDHSGYQDGGHLTVYVVDGRVKARLQSDSASVTLRSAEGSIVAGQEHEVAVSFGPGGFRLFVDGELADSEIEFTQGIAANLNSLVIGANAWSRDGDRDNLRNFFSGSIHNLAIYDLAYEDIDFTPDDEENTVTDAALVSLARDDALELLPLRG